MEKEMKKQFRDFESAREFARKLNLKSQKEWLGYCKSGMKPVDIPVNPDRTYKNKGWTTWGYFLGTGTVAPRNQAFRPFKEAREFARSLNLKGHKEWQEYCKSGNKPDDIPSAPHGTYKNEFKGSGDWLGTGTVANFDKAFRPFKEARDFVRSLGLKNQKEWQEYCKSGNKPDDIHTAPNKIYKNEFKGMGDFLGTGTVAPKDRIYLTFAETREFVEKLELKGQKEWKEYCASGNKPDNIPSNPNLVYENEFKGMGDFLGTGTVAPKDRIYLTFKEAREFVRSLGLKNTKEWQEYCASGNKPDNMSSNPNRTYKKDFKGYGDWLGTGTVATNVRAYRPFKEARDFVRSLGLKNYKEWQEYCASGNKPDNIHTAPDKIYKKDFKGMGDFLGTGTVAPQNKVYRSYHEAREFVRSLGLKNYKEWQEYCASGNKPDNIPSNPNRQYKNDDYVDLGDWLGTGTVSTQKRQYRPFKEARDFVRSLGLKNYKEWQEYCASGNKPDDIPNSPWNGYKEWKKK
jgi:hypothetical protein